MVNNTNHWQTANRVCTPQQLTALQLRTKGLSYRTIALHLGISQQRAHQLVDRALQKIELELRKEPAA
jgi:DNA-binding CsgD family transcriptional regulator